MSDLPDDDRPDDDDWDDGATGDFAVDSEPPGGEEQPKVEKPPEKYADGSWYDRSRANWWWDSKLDPCPVLPMGHGPGGLYYFVTPRGELRKFTSAMLHRSGGLADLFAARLWWVIKHFPGHDKKGNPTRRPNTIIAAEAMMRAAVDAGYISGDVEHRMAGTWRGPDGRPVVHAGDVLICNGEILRPGTRLGAPLYVIAGKRERPALESRGIGHASGYARVDRKVGDDLIAALMNWNFRHDGSAELVAGYVAAACLGDATQWRSHMFLRARPGAGKSTLMLLLRAALGGAGQEIATTYSGAFIEQEYFGQACAILLDENESDSDPNRLKKVRELVRLLSDQGGAKGGRGGADGQSRKLDVRGAVCLAATMLGQMKQQDRERISVIEIERLQEDGRTVVSQEEIEALIRRVGETSHLVRARVLGRWDLFCENLKRARARIVELGGTARDGNQLGHLLAGWWTLTCDDPADDEALKDVSRFSRWIVALNDATEGTDPASKCWSYMLGSNSRKWMGGETLTIGQVIARAREPGGGESHRRALQGTGLRLLPDDLNDRNPDWRLVPLAIANVHPGLDEVFAGSDWSDGRWADVLCDLEFHPIGGAKVKVVPHGPVRFGGPQSRGVLVPAEHLPSLKDEDP